MSMYADNMTLRAARERFFADNATVFGADGGYNAKWVKVELGPIPMYFPNFDARKRSVRLHDLHHIASGYSTDIVGEAEIGAWEVGAGCGDHWAAWILNLWALALGLVIAPRRTFRAFVRGRRTDTLYHAAFDESLLDQSVGSLRAMLRLDQSAMKIRMADIVQFVIWSAIAVLSTPVVPPLLLAAIIVALVLVF